MNRAGWFAVGFATSLALCRFGLLVAGFITLLILHIAWWCFKETS